LSCALTSSSRPENDGLGCEFDARRLLDEYIDDRLRFARSFRTDMRIVVDAANGSGCNVAGPILGGTGATVDVRFCEPDGVNINFGCGATAPQELARIVGEMKADLGFALDGDADRCVAVDERGEVVDGDQLIGIIALDRLSRNALPQGIVVASVLSNGGLEKALTDAGGRLARTPVGDKYIVDGMMVMDAGLGGEKSGPRHHPRPRQRRRRHHHGARDPEHHRADGTDVERTCKTNSALPAAAADDPRSSQGPVGGRSDFCPRRRGGAAVARWGRPNPRPAIRH